MFAIIGGSGLCELEGLNIVDQVWPDTPFGEISGPIQIGQFNGRDVAFLARHGNPHRIPPHLINYRANLFALKKIGVKSIIAVNAVGAINESFVPTSLCVPDQIIDYTYGRDHTIYDGVHCDVVDHIDFTFPYEESLRRLLIAHAQKLNIPCMSFGVYGATQGPRLESAAEIKRCANDGCDMVGMTGMPEAAIARELDLSFACIAISVNWGAGMTDTLITMDEIYAALERGVENVRSLLASVLNDC